jgi:hypothetical protein
MSRSSPLELLRRPRWPWIALALGLAWTTIIRIPLVLNAEDHLDSDLAVDGLTLLDAANGQWRWHYPGTPHMGIVPVLASYPQAVIWGADPITLVSGGTVLWALVVVSTFWLAWTAFGPSPACWAIVPLVFSSLGTIWLSGRITGGHLLALAWHTLAFVGLYACVARREWRSAAILGVWCGLGVYVDAMSLFTIAGITGAAIVNWLTGDRSPSNLVMVAAFLAGLAVGVLPREIGRRVDPYDAYPAQFAVTFDPEAVTGHAELLTMECLPRLIAGVRLPSHRGREVAICPAFDGPPALIATCIAGRLARDPAHARLRGGGRPAHGGRNPGAGRRPARRGLRDPGLRRPHRCRVSRQQEYLQFR